MPKKNPAPVELTDDQLTTDYPEQFHECRAGQHQWRWQVAGRNNGFVVLRGLCRQCKTVRQDTVSANSGSLVHRSYDYPEGYCGIGWHPKDEFRKVWLNDLLRKEKSG